MAYHSSNKAMQAKPVTCRRWVCQHMNRFGATGRNMVCQKEWVNPSAHGVLMMRRIPGTFGFCSHMEASALLRKGLTSLEAYWRTNVPTPPLHRSSFLTFPPCFTSLVSLFPAFTPRSRRCYRHRMTSGGISLSRVFGYRRGAPSSKSITTLSAVAGQKFAGCLG